MSHVHRVVVLIGVRYHIALEAREDFGHRASFSWKLLRKSLLELLVRAGSRDLTLPRSRRFEIASRYGGELFSDFERGIGLQLGENVVDHAANLLRLTVEESILGHEVGELGPPRHAQLPQNVRQMCAPTAACDIERAPVILL